jgi:hypothetical protein
MTEQTPHQALAHVFGGLMNAMTEDMKIRAKHQSLNEALQKTIPENPPRDSYWFWVALCRQYTGQSMCDSGGAYGYNYNAAYKQEDDDPITVEFWRAKEASASISLPHWLHVNFDASDEDAVALEEVLYWAATWLWGNEHWRYAAENLHDVLENHSREWIRSYGSGYNEEYRLYKKPAREFLHWWYREKHDHLSYNQRRTMVEEEYVDNAMADLPINSFKLLYEHEARKADENYGFNVYNSENDFDQVLQCDGAIESWGELYFILRSHNGCDVRGGYSAPVVARALDPDYIWDWTIDAYCPKCDGQWPMLYEYGRAFEEQTRRWSEIIGYTAKINGAKVEIDKEMYDLLRGYRAVANKIRRSVKEWTGEPTGVSSKLSAEQSITTDLDPYPIYESREEVAREAIDVNTVFQSKVHEMAEKAQLWTEIENGQNTIPGIEAPPLPPGQEIKDWIGLLDAFNAFHEDDPDGEYNWPIGVASHAEEGGEVTVPDQDGFSSFPNQRVRLLCPECLRYTVGVYNSVYGH